MSAVRLKNTWVETKQNIVKPCTREQVCRKTYTLKLDERHPSEKGTQEHENPEFHDDDSKSMRVCTGECVVKGTQDQTEYKKLDGLFKARPCLRESLVDCGHCTTEYIGDRHRCIAKCGDNRCNRRHYDDSGYFCAYHMYKLNPALKIAYYGGNIAMYAFLSKYVHDSIQMHFVVSLFKETNTFTFANGNDITTTNIVCICCERYSIPESRFCVDHYESSLICILLRLI